MATQTSPSCVSSELGHNLQSAALQLTLQLRVVVGAMDCAGALAGVFTNCSGCCLVLFVEVASCSGCCLMLVVGVVEEP